MALGFFWATVSLGIFIAVFIVDKMGFFSRRNHFPVAGRTVLITGGSQGLGKALAQLIASKGGNVVIVARTLKTLESALDEIEASASSPQTQRFHFISADLSSPTDSARALADATKWNNSHPPDLVLCCAGASRPDYFVTSPATTIADHIRTNYLSAAHIAQASARSWLGLGESATPAKATTPPSPPQDPPKHIVFVSSISVFAPVPGYTAYSPAKAALRCLSEQLSEEFLLYEHHTPIRTHCVFANTMLTPGLSVENETKPEITKIVEEGDSAQSAESAARETMRKLERGDENITIDGIMGWALRSSMLGFSRRNGSGVGDTVLGAVVTPFLPLVRKDFESKIRKFGKKTF